MLFISIMQVLIFGVLILIAVILRDIAFMITTMFPDDEEEPTEEMIELAKKTEDGRIYHLNCKICGYDWWSIEPYVKYCPNCGEKNEIVKQ